MKLDSSLGILPEILFTLTCLQQRAGYTVSISIVHPNTKHLQLVERSEARQLAGYAPGDAVLIRISATPHRSYCQRW